jgi:hypothetical protein
MKVYVVCNRTEPLAVFDNEDAAEVFAVKLTKEWVQPIRVFEMIMNEEGFESCSVFQRGDT